MAAKKKQIDEKQVKDWIDRAVKKFEEMDCSDKKEKNKVYDAGASGWFWFLGAIGAAAYFWQYVTSFSTAVVAIGKAFIWPAFAIFHFFKFLKI